MTYAGKKTGFLDSRGEEVRAGDIVRVEVEYPFEQVHGEWAEHRVVFRNGVWLAEYWRSDKGQILPIGYGAQELSDFRAYEGKEWLFAENDALRKLSVEVVDHVDPRRKK